MVRVRIAFRGVEGVIATLLHHSRVVLLVLQLEGRNPGCATQFATRSQIRRV